MSTSKISRLYRSPSRAGVGDCRPLGLPVVDDSLWWMFATDSADQWGAAAQGAVQAVLPISERCATVDLTDLIDQLEAFLRRVRQELRKRDLSPVSRQQFNLVAGRVQQQIARAKLALVAQGLREDRDETAHTLEATDLIAGRRSTLEEKLAQLSVDLHRAEADVRLFDLQCELDELEREAAKPGASRKDFEDRISTCMALMQQVEEDKERGPPAPVQAPPAQSSSAEASDSDLKHELGARLQRERTRFGDPFGR